MTTIDDFPELSGLQETDKIVLFYDNGNGNYTPRIEDISALSEILVEKEKIESLSALFNELEKQEEKLEKDISNLYGDAEFIEENCADNEFFNLVTNKIEKIVDMLNKLNGKATKEYFETAYQQILLNIKNFKKIIGGSRWKIENGKNTETFYGYKGLLALRAQASE